MLQPESWTVARLLKWTTDYLGSRGSDSPRLDAEVLLAKSLGCQRIDLYTAFEKVPDEGVRSAFRELVLRRAKGMPVAYLVGFREFYSLPFRVTPDVLIPRPETEFLVIALLDIAKRRSNQASIEICDIGTGSGIVAICVAKHLENACVTAVDLSSAALQVASANVADHGLSDRIELIESDLFKSVPSERRFDFVVSNPPYISSTEMESLAPGVKDYEPRLALESGPRGTEVIEKIVVQSAERLLVGGYLLIEISPMIHDAVFDLIESDGHFELVQTVQDLARLPRVVKAVRK